MWIDHPTNSVVLTVKADLRLVKTATFASDYSLRFPRVTGVRWDKPWHECLSDAELERRVREDGGIAVRGDPERGTRETAEGDRGEKKKRKTRDVNARDENARLPAHLAPSDVRRVAARDDALRALDVFFITAGAGAGAAEAARAAALKLELAGLLQSRGGTHSEARHAGNTHTSSRRVRRRRASGSKPRRATRGGGADVLTPEWLRACVDAGRVVAPRPKHRLFLSQHTVDAAEGRLDVFGDAHVEDVDAEDVLALLDGDRVASAAAAAAARGEAPDDAARDATYRDARGGAVFAGARSRFCSRRCHSGGSAPLRHRVDGRDDLDDLDDLDEQTLVLARAYDPEWEKASLGYPSIEPRSSVAAATARRDVASDPAAHLPSRFGEAARLAAGLAVSLRLRGASVSDFSRQTEHTHVLVVTADALRAPPAARARGWTARGSAWGERRATR